MIYSAFDPGGTTGWAILEDGMPKQMGQTPYDNLHETLDTFSFGDLIVIEDYFIRPESISGFQHQWNDGKALRVIGMLDRCAHTLGIPVAMQQPSIKPSASKAFGVPWEKGNHMHDAILHGMWWWFKNKGPEGMHFAKDETTRGGEAPDGEGVRTPAVVTQIDDYSGLQRKRNKKRLGMP